MKQSNKRFDRHYLPLNFKLLCYFLLFGFAIVIVLWVFQTFFLDTVFQAGPNPCPPMVVGVGIGGTFERAAQLAKKATFRPIDSKNEDERYAQLEDELLTEINKMGFGPAGLGGNTTAIGVNIETSPTHIAGMPVAVNICCHAARHASATI